MSKLAFSKLGLKKNENIKEILLNDQTIEVKQYLSMDEKIALITKIINQGCGDTKFENPLQIEVFTIMNLIFSYTNISFTEKQKEDVNKLYDLLRGNGIIELIFNAIPEQELTFILDMTYKTIKNAYTYNQSVLGILDNLGQNYNNLSFDIESLKSSISDPQNLTLLKEILTKMG